MHNQNSKPQSPHPMKVLIYFLIWILVIYTVLLLIKDQEPNTEWTSPQFPRPPNEYDTRPPSESPQPPNPSTEITEIVCKSPECITLAHHLHNWQDISVDPCQDFYQATCGKYNEPRKSQKTRFGHMTGIMYNLVTEHLNKNEPNTSKLEKAMRVYYDKCEESSEQTADEENAERMRELFQTVQKIGSWPMADSHWNEDDFNLNNMISNMASLGKTNFGVFSVKPTKDSHIEVSLDRELTKELDENKLNKFIGDILTTNNIKINQDIMKSDMEDIEELIHHILMPHHFSSKSSAPLSKLQKNVRAIDFERILKTFVNPSKKEMLWSKIADRVVVKNQGYFFDGTKNVKTILKTTTTRTLANFLIYNFLRSEFKKHELEDKSNCAQTLLNTFPISALRIFARSRFDKKKLKGASEMAEEIRDSLIEIIQKSTWLHEKTKMKAIQKVKKMNMRVGYLKELEISGELDLFYDSIIASSTDSSFPEFEKISEKFEIEQSMDFVASHLPILSNNDYFEEHAFYQSSKNRLVVNVPFIDDPFFDPTYLKYAKIANFGEVIAHEMGHSFDSKGRKRDENGEKNNWWTSEDSSEYEKRSQCLLDQYNENYGTGNSTKSSKINEMITDMIGVAVAWNAYNKLDLTNEPKIIGFEDYHMDKMFFRLTASNWCGAESKAFDVNGVFSNMKSFAKAFHCPVGSPMNPEKKCELF